MDFQSWIHMATKELSQSDNPRRDAEILLENVTNKTRTWILTFNKTKLTKTQIQQLKIFLSRRKNGEPIAYLIGMHEFWSLPLYVSTATMIPRPDTECLVEQTLVRLPSYPCQILDLGTGTGAIALALASERPDCQVIATDVASDVVQLAKRNVEYLGIRNVQIIQSNWFDALSGRMFNIIVSNPPYIDKKDSHLLQDGVRFEPRMALVSNEEGLGNIRHIIITSRQYLHTNGWLLVEHGWKQGELLRMIFTKAGFHDIKTYRDYGGNNRLTLGKWV